VKLLAPLAATRIILTPAVNGRTGTPRTLMFEIQG
jgi:hypothetical protein